MSALRLEPLRCPACGIAQRLSPGASIECHYCQASVEVPSKYQRQYEYGLEAKRARRDAEALLRKVLVGACPCWAPKAWGFIGTPVAVIGVPALLWATKDAMHWRPGTWIAFGGFGPLLISMLVLAYLAVRSQPFAYLAALGGKIRPGPVGEKDGAVSCGVCGAPLSVEPEQLAATCDYCLSDSWLKAAPSAHVEETDSQRKNLRDLVAAEDFRHFDTIVFLGVSTVVVGGFLSGLWFLG